MMDVIIPVGDMPVTAQVTTPGKAIVAAQVSAAGTEAALQAADRADAAASNADASAAKADAATAAAKAATESASSASASATESAAKADQATADAQAATTAAQTATEAAKSATDAANVATSNADAATDRANAAAENAESIVSGAVATTETVGVVKASASVPVAEDGTMSVNLGAADGTLPVAHGGTGATTAAAALANLGAATASDGRTRNDITPLVRDGTLSGAVRANDLAARGLKVGDYFTGKSGYTYHLADMDTFYGGYNSYAVVAQHHAGIVVDTHTDDKWNDAADTSNGYVSSKLHSLLVNTHLPVIRSDIADLTGGDAADHLIAHSKLYSTNVQNGASSDWAWSSGQYISALTEMQVYGVTVWSSSGYDTGEAFRQLGVFAKFYPSLLFGNDAVWLRDVDSATGAAVLKNSGGIVGGYTSTDQLRVAGLILFH